MQRIESSRGLNPNLFEANQDSASHAAEATFIAGSMRTQE